jgi:hypothetical protein
MVIQNITVCIQVQIVPTAHPVLPDSIATNFVMWHVDKIIFFLVCGEEENHTQVCLFRECIQP